MAATAASGTPMTAGRRQPYVTALTVGAALVLALAATLAISQRAEAHNGSCTFPPVVHSGADIIGTSGNDNLDCRNLTSAHTFRLRGGIDVLLATSYADTIYGGGGADAISALGGADMVRGGPGADDLYGYAAADTLYGDDGDDLLTGDDGRDTVRGGDGDDELYGGYHADHLVGGPGTDHCYGGPGVDTSNGCEFKHDIP